MLVAEQAEIWSRFPTHIFVTGPRYIKQLSLAKMSTISKKKNKKAQAIQIACLCNMCSHDSSRDNSVILLYILLFG